MDLEFITDASSVFYRLFPLAPRTTMNADNTSQVYAHTGHVYESTAEMVTYPIQGQEPTTEELIGFADKFEEVRRGRAIYSFVGVAAAIVKQGEALAILSMPCLISRAQPTPCVVYRGENNLPLPSYATKSSIGFDIAADSPFSLQPGERKVVKTGLFLDPKEWDRNSPCYLRIAPKSGLAVSKGIDVLAGVVDGDYPDEIGVVLMNHSDQLQGFNVGDKIAQGIWEVAIHGGNLSVNQSTRTGGFGSTN